MHLHYLQGVLSFYFAKVIKTNKVTNSIKSTDYNVYMIVIVDAGVLTIYMKHC